LGISYSLLSLAGASKRLEFKCVADKIIHLAIPKDFEIIKTEMAVKGINFPVNPDNVNVLPREFGTTVLVKEAGSDEFSGIYQDINEAFPLEVTSIIIDFHTKRTVTGLILKYTPLPEVPNDSLQDGFCILRVLGGSIWYLPIPKNLFKLEISGTNDNNIITKGLPGILTEKLLLTFAKLKQGSAYITHANASENLNELGSVTIEEQGINLVDLEIITCDFLTGFFVQVGDNPPFFNPKGEFFTDGQEYVLPDFSKEINRFLETADPVYPHVNDMLAQYPLNGYNNEFGYLQQGLPFSLVPLRVHTDMSGILEISSLSFDYVRCQKGFNEEEGAESPADEKVLRFERNEERLSTIAKEISVNLQDVGSIEYISMKIEGSLSSDQIIPLTEIRPPISPDIDSNLVGFQLTAGKKAAQRVTFARPFRLKGIDFRTKFITKVVDFRVEIRADKDNHPGKGILAAKDLDYVSETEKGAGQIRDFTWIQVDFDQEVELTEGTYWIIMKSREGECVWQIIKKTGTGVSSFFHAHEDRPTEWQSVNDSPEREVHGIFRIRHIPRHFGLPPSLLIKLNGQNILSFEENPQKVNIMLEKQLNITGFPDNTQNVVISFEARCTGELKVSDFLLKFREKEGKRISISGFVESMCFS
jgi:hypothetical protein